MSTPQKSVVVLGSGVIGLTSALRLVESGYKVTIVARDLPSDSSSQQFASPWAGANWHSFHSKREDDERQSRWETFTFKKIWDLIPAGLAMKLDGIDYSTEPFEELWFKDVTPNYRNMDHSEVPPHLKYGIAYTTWSVNAPEYIKWLETRLRSLGVRFVRASVDSIEQPFLVSYTEGEVPVDVVVNATGLGARSLVGVEDEKVHPVRGQTVLVWAPHYNKTISVIADKSQPPTYIIPRPNGEVILGGTFLKDDWNLSPSAESTTGIVSRCLALDPALSHSGSTDPSTIPIIRVNVGLRPSREGGARLEQEVISVPLASRPFVAGTKRDWTGMEPRKVHVVHAYGIGGAGYQTSWGMAEDVLELVSKCFAEKL